MRRKKGEKKFVANLHKMLLLPIRRRGDNNTGFLTALVGISTTVVCVDIDPAVIPTYVRGHCEA